MFPLIHFSVLLPPYVTAPQTIIETSLFLGGQTRYGASFSSSRLQQYILESLPITIEHSSENQKFYQVSKAQFLRALAHLIRNSLFFVLITIDFLIAVLTYFSFFNCLYIVDFENFVGFSAKKVLKMWSVDAPTFVLTIRLSLLASRVLKVDGRPLHQWFSTHPVSFHFLIIDWTVARIFLSNQ